MDQVGICSRQNGIDISYSQEVDLIGYCDGINIGEREEEMLRMVSFFDLFYFIY